MQAHNPAAQYVKGLRLAAQEAASPRALELLFSSTDIIYARFALGLVLVFSGAFDHGIQVMDSFFNLIPTIEDAEEIAEIVISQVEGLDFPRGGLYDNSFRYGGGLPHCFLYIVSVRYLCRRCFVYKYATRFQHLC